MALVRKVVQLCLEVCGHAQERRVGNHPDFREQSLELFPSQIVEIFDEGPYVVLVRVRGPVIELWKPRADEEAVDFKNWLVNQLDESISIKTR